MLWKFIRQLYSVMRACDHVGSHGEGVPGESPHGLVFRETELKSLDFKNPWILEPELKSLEVKIQMGRN